MSRGSRATRVLLTVVVFALFLGTFVDAVAPSYAHARRGQRVLAVLRRIERTMTETRYQPRTSVHTGRGIYLWDCSGMTAWVLSKAAPGSLRAIGRARPVARDFARVIRGAPTEGGISWRRVSSVGDAQPGDVFAWERQPRPESPLTAVLRPPRVHPDRGSRRRIVTGHVGFVVAPAERVSGGWLLHIADSTSRPHGDDTRAATGATGYGRGNILVLENELGATQLGWQGLSSGWLREVPLVIGRPLR